MNGYGHGLMKSLDKNCGHSGPLPSWERLHSCHKSDLTTVQTVNIFTHMEMCSFINIFGFTYFCLKFFDKSTSPLCSLCCPYMPLKQHDTLRTLTVFLTCLPMRLSWWRTPGPTLGYFRYEMYELEHCLLTFASIFFPFVCEMVITTVSFPVIVCCCCCCYCL